MPINLNYEQYLLHTKSELAFTQMLIQHVAELPNIKAIHTLNKFRDIEPGVCYLGDFGNAKSGASDIGEYEFTLTTGETMEGATQLNYMANAVKEIFTTGEMIAFEDSLTTIIQLKIENKNNRTVFYQKHVRINYRTEVCN